MMEGTPPLRGEPYPTTYAVLMLKSKPKNRVDFGFGFRRDKQVDFDFDFNILTAFIRLGRARPEGAGCPPILYGLRLGRAGPVRGRVPSIIIGIVPSILLFFLLFDFGSVF